MADAPSIDDLMNGMTKLTKSGAGKDLKLSPTAHATYTGLIATFRNALAEQCGKAAQLADYGNVGGLFAAGRTKSNLTLAVTGDNGFVAGLNKYLSYLDQFEKAVDEAFKRLQAEDKGH